MAGLAVVLGGGGLKGAYQLGVWKALRELGVRYDVVVGTSIGALNGALMAQGSYEEAEKLWQSICYESVFAGQKYPEIEKIDSRLTMIEHTMRGILWAGGLDVSPLRGLIEKHLDEEKLRASEIGFGLVTAKLKQKSIGKKYKLLPRLAVEELMLSEIPEGKVCDYLLASSACFPVFKPLMIGDCYYIDGGYCDDLPTDLALRANPRELLIVDLEAIGARRHRLPLGVQVRLLRCKWELGPLFCFEKECIDRNIALGYLDCLKEYGVYEGFAYTYEKGEGSRVFERVKAQRLISLDKRKLRKLARRIEQAVNSKAKRHPLKLMRPINLTAEQALCALAEAAGRVFGLPADLVYRFDQFDGKLLEAYESTLSPDGLAGNGTVINKLGKILTKLDKRTLTVVLTRLYIAGEIKDYITEIAAIAPEEMGAALYMVTLIKA